MALLKMNAETSCFVPWRGLNYKFCSTKNSKEFMAGTNIFPNINNSFTPIPWKWNYRSCISSLSAGDLFRYFPLKFYLMNTPIGLQLLSTISSNVYFILKCIVGTLYCDLYHSVKRVPSSLKLQFSNPK